MSKYKNLDTTKYFRYRNRLIPHEEFHNKENNQITKIEHLPQSYFEQLPEIKKKAWGVLLSHNPEYPDLYLTENIIYYGENKNSSSPNIPFISKFHQQIKIERIIDDKGKYHIEISFKKNLRFIIVIETPIRINEIECYESLSILSPIREEISYTFIDCKIEKINENGEFENELLRKYRFGKTVHFKYHSFIKKQNDK